MREIVNKLISLNKTISTMESCTGGAVSNSITNVDGQVKHLSLELLHIVIFLRKRWVFLKR